MKLLRSLTVWSELQGSAIALQDEQQTLNYAELWARVSAEAAYLGEQWAARQLQGRPLALLADNSIAWVVRDLACLLARIPCVPVPPFFSASQRAHLLQDSGCAVLCSHNEGTWSELWLEQAAVTLPAGTCKITYTSGSTGEPKGVCLSTEQLQQTVEALAERVGSLAVEEHLCTMPLAVLLENLAGVYLPLWLGKRVSLPTLTALGLANMQRPEPARFIATLAASRADSLILLPATLNWLVMATASGQLPAERWRLLAVGGGKSGRAVLAQADGLALPVYEGYGLSEVGSVVALNGPDGRRLGTVGKPLSHVQVRLAADGEVQVRGNAMLGYIGDETAPAADSWLSTGDWGEWDADGFLTIQGRKKSTLVTGFGRNVAPEWLEAELAAVPGVLQCCVYGDEASGIQALLFAPALAGTAQGEALLQGCNASLPEYARLTGWRFMTEPLSAERGELTANGRPRRHVILRQRIPLDAAANHLSSTEELS